MWGLRIVFDGALISRRDPPASSWCREAELRTPRPPLLLRVTFDGVYRQQMPSSGANPGAPNARTPEETLKTRNSSQWRQVSVGVHVAVCCRGASRRRDMAGL